MLLLEISDCYRQNRHSHLVADKYNSNWCLAKKHVLAFFFNRKILIKGATKHVLAENDFI